MASHEEISQRPTKSMKFPLGNLIRKFAAPSVKSLKELRRTLIKIRRTLIMAGKEGKLKLHAHTNTLAPSQHINARLRIISHLEISRISPYITNRYTSEYYRLSQITYVVTVGLGSTIKLPPTSTSTIFTSHHHHQPTPRTEPSNRTIA